MRRLVLAAAVGALAGGSGVAALDAVHERGWTVTARALSAEGAIGVQTDDHSYAVPLDVAWRDRRGAYHDSGRPECLPATGREEGPVRIRAVPLDVGGVSLRKVVLVECL